MAPRKTLLPHHHQDPRIAREDRIQSSDRVLAYADGEWPAKSHNLMSESRSLQRALG